MNLTAHLVRKDLRRLAWPVAAWLALLVAGAVGLLLAEWSPELLRTQGAVDWMRSVRSNVMALAIIATCAAVVLAGVLVLEDRLLGTTSFWPTRPIAGWRLLQAKISAALLLLVVAPMAAIVPVWWVAGFDLLEMARTIGPGLFSWSLLALCSLGLASLCANLGQQAFAALTTGGLSIVTLLVLPSIWERGLGKADVLETQATLVIGILVVAAVVTLIWQYRTRRTRVGWAIWIAGLVLIAGVRMFWTWDPSDLTADREPAQSPLPGLTMRVLPSTAAPGQPTALEVGMPASAGEARSSAPMGGAGRVRGLDGANYNVRLGRGERWGHDAARRAIGLGEKTAVDFWPLSTSLVWRPSEGNLTEAAAFRGRLEFAELRTQVLYEMPVRVGAEANRGGSRTRILGWGHNDPAALWVEERSALRGWPGLQLKPPQIEVYVLVHRASGAVREVRAQDHGTASLFGLGLALRTLHPAAAGSGGEINAGAEGWSLVKVRLEPVRWFTREFAHLPLKSQGVPQHP